MSASPISDATFERFQESADGRTVLLLTGIPWSAEEAREAWSLVTGLRRLKEARVNNLATKRAILLWSERLDYVPYMDSLLALHPPSVGVNAAGKATNTAASAAKARRRRNAAKVEAARLRNATTTGSP